MPKNENGRLAKRLVEPSPCAYSSALASSVSRLLTDEALGGARSEWGSVFPPTEIDVEDPSVGCAEVVAVASRPRAKRLTHTRPLRAPGCELPFQRYEGAPERAAHSASEQEAVDDAGDPGARLVLHHESVDGSFIVELEVALV